MIERQLAAQFALSGAHLGQVQLVQYPAFGVENSSQNMGRKGFAGAVLPAKGIAHVAIDHGGPQLGPGGPDEAQLQAQSGTACPQARGEGIGRSLAAPLVTDSQCVAARKISTSPARASASSISSARGSEVGTGWMTT